MRDACAMHLPHVKEGRKEAKEPQRQGHAQRWRRKRESKKKRK